MLSLRGCVLSVCGFPFFGDRITAPFAGARSARKSRFYCAMMAVSTADSDRRFRDSIIFQAPTGIGRSRKHSAVLSLQRKTPPVGVSEKKRIRIRRLRDRMPLIGHGAKDQNREHPPLPFLRKNRRPQHTHTQRLSFIAHKTRECFAPRPAVVHRATTLHREFPSMPLPPPSIAA